jgi:hypothetical protein
VEWQQRRAGAERAEPDSTPERIAA